jgi:hypothetical protein
LKILRKFSFIQANEKMDDAIVQALYKLYGQKATYGIMPMSIQWLGNSSVATIPTLFDLVVHGKQEGHELQDGRCDPIRFGWSRNEYQRGLLQDVINLFHQ